MIKLSQTIQALNNSNFKTIAKQEIETINKQALPLQQGLSHSSYVSDEAFSVVILNHHETEQRLIIKTGIFYSGIIAGCSCADDPTPLDLQNEYCEIQFSIDKISTETEITLLEN